jgi:hypothetical protein
MMNVAEISYDLVMEPEMPFVEGVYRLSDQDWQVFIFSRGDIETVRVRHATWNSGVTGIHVTVPRSRTMNQSVVEEVLSSALGVDRWAQVRGPDSMQLR